MSGASLLEVQSLTTILPAARGQLTALRDVSFSLQEGEILGLVGESGSGKRYPEIIVAAVAGRFADSGEYLLARYPCQ
jgi:peptide/nickel transport system ATP-binding protein/oligopeptide transport system ATP-binding protein